MHLKKSLLVSGYTALILGISAAGYSFAGDHAEAKNYGHAFHDENGKINLASMDFARDWESLGTWSVDANDDGEVNELHKVFASPGTISHFNEHGSFEDGTVLVKELHAVETNALKTGQASSSTGAFGIFVMIKDSSNQFDGKPNWDKGWGWAFFEPDEPNEDVMPLNKCIECHIPAQDTDWVYTFGYPALKTSE